ncbi:MAG: hypothetical protein VKK04_15505 [Synechococcales bacterium]|nr:hypothetical protein [Synechococcales bacterium]
MYLSAEELYRFFFKFEQLRAIAQAIRIYLQQIEDVFTAAVTCAQATGE